MMPIPERESDSIWIPYSYGEEQVVGLVLRAGITRALYNDKPVYQLYSCFVLGQTHDLIVNYWTGDLIRSYFGENWQYSKVPIDDFYLE